MARRARLVALDLEHLARAGPDPEPARERHPQSPGVQAGQPARGAETEQVAQLSPEPPVPSQRGEVADRERDLVHPELAPRQEAPATAARSEPPPAADRSATRSRHRRGP